MKPREPVPAEHRFHSKCTEKAPLQLLIDPTAGVGEEQWKMT